MTAFQSNQVSSAALIRWWEMDAQAARPAIIREIERPHHRFDASVLGMLPEKELPEVEQQLANRLTQEGGRAEQTASLISRYATAAIEPAVARRNARYPSAWRHAVSSHTPADRSNMVDNGRCAQAEWPRKEAQIVSKDNPARV